MWGAYTKQDGELISVIQQTRLKLEGESSSLFNKKIFFDEH